MAHNRELALKVLDLIDALPTEEEGAGRNVDRWAQRTWADVYHADGTDDWKSIKRYDREVQAELVNELVPIKCATTACFAGWTVAMVKGRTFLTKGELAGRRNDAIVDVNEDRYYYNIEAWARELLGFDYDESNYVFQFITESKAALRERVMFVLDGKFAEMYSDDDTYDDDTDY